MVGSYPSAEMQMEYFTALADWAMKDMKLKDTEEIKSCTMPQLHAISKENFPRWKPEWNEFIKCQGHYSEKKKISFIVHFCLDKLQLQS